MQKKLIALAIAGLASTAAFAQANVTIYGVVDASVDVTNSGDTAGVSGTRTSKISSNQSRIGLKGKEDLGDGLNAVFQLETAFNADGTAASNLNSRNTYVGLQADSWGQMILGQYDTPYKTSTRGWDLFADHLADNRNLMGQGFMGFDIRAANTLRYDLSTHGFNLAAAYVTGAENATRDNQTKGKAWSLSGSYDVTNAWTVVAAYQKNQFGSAGTGTLAAPANPAFLPLPPAVPAGLAQADDSEKAWKLGVGYQQGACRASVVYENTKFELGGDTLERKAWTVAGGYTFAGNNEIKLAYTKADKLEDGDNTGAKQWAIGIDHILSKRTKLYAEYVKLTNEDNVGYGLNGAGSNTTGGNAVLTGSDPSAFQFGVKHTF